MLLSNILIWVIVVLMGVVIVMAGSKRRHYVVYTADNNIEFLTRKVFEWEVSGIVVFRDDNKNRIIMSKHWILKIVELPKDEWEKQKKEANA